MRLLADRDATIAAQAGTIIEQARLIERLVGQVEQLADRVCELDRRVGKDSTNSSWPSSSDSPYTKAIDAGGIWPAFTGVLMRDGYHGYTHLTQALHAWCGAHTRGETCNHGDRSSLAHDARTLTPEVRCWRTLAGLVDFAAVQSYLSTATKWGLDTLDVLERLFTTSPWLPPAAEPR
ncbi:DUF6444 domain-containing protein [Parafrankia sp. FMc2]|uniref:DUF6444 domain-containing protein n=1 Tax=Parafrankia sp. FMc2 TaxID=3233196 RepID=UPI0034D56B9D